MKKLYLILFIIINLSAEEKVANKTLFTSNIIPKHMNTSTKKRRFYSLLLSSIQKVHNELQEQYLKTKSDLKESKNSKRIQKLKELYRVDSDEKLLLALKPHPKSITLAQAAIESAWGTSRFFTQANNVFGIWSKNKNDKRIAAKEKRNGKSVIWLKKFDTIEESVREYYKTIARVKAYKKFRKYRYESNDVFKIIKGLDVYSEMGDEYVKQLAKMIKYNNFKKYD